jgi:PAS domain S-box-containing protein
LVVYVQGKLSSSNAIIRSAFSRIEDSNRRLSEAEKRLSTAFQNVAVGIVICDSEGKISLFNLKSSEIFGFKEYEALGANISMFLDVKFDEIKELYDQIHDKSDIERASDSSLEYVGTRKDGTNVPVNVGVEEVNLGVENQYIVSIVDLTEQKKLAAQLRQSQKMEAIGQLVGGIAHDFNNLLGIIKGNLDLMKRQIPVENKLGERLSRALTATDRGAALTARLLSFSRQKADTIEAVDVHEIIHDLADLLQKSITNRVEIRLTSNESDCWAFADRGELEDAITNICLNARDAMPDGGEIAISTRILFITEYQSLDLKDLKAGRYVEISISDNGCGIPPEIIDKIFDPFFSTKEPGKGTGLGLSMVYGFAKRSGGAIKCTSQKGDGTTFRIYLPSAAGAAKSGVTNARQVPLGEFRGGQGTVLVVDDEEDILEIAKESLIEAGYDVLTAGNGVDALEVLDQRSSEVSIVLSDVIMPGGISGHELSERITQAYPHIKVCLASGYAGNPDSGVIGNDRIPLLKKPYSNVELTDFIFGVLDD